MPGTEKLIQILVEAKDHASKELQGVTSSLEAMSTPAKGLSSILGGLGKVAGGLALGGAVAGVGALGAVLASGVSDARDANQVFAQTENVIKSTGGAAGFTSQQIADMAGSLSAASGKSLFGDDDIERGQNMLLTFTNIKETLPDATQMMLDLSQATGQDMQSSALQLGKALNDPIAGISALTRVGVSFSDQQKDQIKTMQEAGNVAGAQGVILQELQKEFGGSALAAAAADGGMAQFRDRMGELGESIGQKVLPMLNAFMDWLNSPAVQAGIQAVADALITGIGAAFRWLSDVGIPALTAGWNALMSVMGPVASFLQSALGPAFQGVMGVLSQFWTDIEPKVSAAWANIQAIITAAMDVIVPFVQSHMEQIKAIMDGIWMEIKGIVEIAWGLISGIIKVGLDVLAGDWSGAWNDMKAAAATIWDGIKLVIGGDVQAIKNLFLVGWDAVTGAWSALWSTIENAVVAPLQRAQDFVNGAVQNILGYIIHAIDRIQELISWIGRIPGIHVAIPSPGGGGGSGDNSDFGPGTGATPAPPSGGNRPSSDSHYHFNFYGPTDGDDVVRALRSTGTA